MIQTLVQQIKDELSNLETEAIEKQATIDRANATITEKQSQFDAIEKSTIEAEQQHKIALSKLGEEARPLRTEVQRLKDEVNTLVARKGDLMTANAQLEAANKKLIAYEKGAWVALNAKDQELNAREHNLSQKEQLRPGSKSFLPSVVDN